MIALDPDLVWGEVLTEFGHVSSGGKLTGMSTGDYGVKLHFDDEPAAVDEKTG